MQIETYDLTDKEATLAQCAGINFEYFFEEIDKNTLNCKLTLTEATGVPMTNWEHPTVTSTKWVGTLLNGSPYGQGYNNVNDVRDYYLTVTNPETQEVNGFMMTKTPDDQYYWQIEMRHN